MRPDPRFDDNELLDEAFAALDARTSGWVVLRGIGRYAGDGDDVDVLVRPASGGPVDRLLSGTSFVRVAPGGRGSHRFPLRIREREFRAYVQDNDTWVDLDLLTEVAFGLDLEYRTALAGELIGRRRRVNGVERLEPVDEFWYVALHDLLKRGCVAAHRWSVLCEDAATIATTGPVHQLAERVLPGSAQRLLRALQHQDLGRARELGSALQRAWQRRRPVGTLVVRAVSRVVRDVPSPAGGGLSVALVGPDGAGKTTLAAALRGTMPVPSAYVYLGIWRDMRYESVLRWLIGARLAVRLFSLLGKARWIAWQRRMGRLVLLDRFTADADLPYDRFDWRGRVSAAIVRRTVPDPDLVLVLDAPGALMFARKGEHTEAELEESRSNYLRIAHRFRHHAVIDATRPADVVRREATALIWRRWSGAELEEPARGV